jgi:transcriptional regulator with XRE-family HTH domain
MSDDVVALLLGDEMPAERLGEILRASRKRKGWKRKHVAELLDISARRLRAYEDGTQPIPADVCTQLADLYGDHLAAQVSSRDLPRIDQGWLVVGDEHHALREVTVTDVVTHYADVLQRVRGARPGEAVPLRAADLAALSAALETDADTMEQRIMDALGCTREEARSLHRELLRRRVVLPVAGLAAGIVALAGIQAAGAKPADPVQPKPAAVHGPVVAAPTSTIAPSHPTTPATAPPITSPPVTTTPTTHAPIAPPPPAPVDVAPQTDPITPPTIDPNDHSPVGILPGETPVSPPVTDISTAISTVEDAQ